MKKETRIIVYETIECPEGSEYTAYVVLRGALAVEHVGLVVGGRQALEEFLAGSELGRGVRIRARLNELSCVGTHEITAYEDFIKHFFTEVYKLLC